MPPGDRNPFQYARPSPPERVLGRDELCDRLLRVVRNRGLATLIGPRRFGKTSVLGRVAWLSPQVDVDAVISVDCYGVTSAADFAGRLQVGFGELSGTARQIARTLFAGSKLGLSFDAPFAGGASLTAQFGAPGAPDPTSAVQEFLDNIIKISERRGGLLLILDEFQDVGDVAGLEGLLRSRLQHAHEVAIIFAGSQPSLMSQLFSDRRRPFYAQAQMIDIPRFTRTESVEIVGAGFAATGLDAGDVSLRLADAVQGHPQRLVLSAHVAWEMVSDGQDPTDALAVDALAEARQLAHNDVMGLIEGLPRTHRDTLRAVAMFGSPRSRPAERALDLSRSSANNAAEALVASGFLEQTGDGRWRIVDPFVADALQNLDRAPGIQRRIDQERDGPDLSR